MTWQGQKLKVDLVATHHTDMPLDGARRAERRFGKKRKDFMLRAILALGVLGLMVQGIHIYLCMNAIDRLETAHRLSDVQPETPNVLNNNKLMPQKNSVVIYSYVGISTLLGIDVLINLLRDHSDVFYIQHTLRWDSGFPDLSQNMSKSRLDKIFNCEPRLLNRLLSKQISSQPAQYNSEIRHSGCNTPQANMIIRCLENQLTVVEIYAEMGLGLKGVYSSNGTTKILHIAADPRLVMMSMWNKLQTKKYSQSMSYQKDYCANLGKDMKVVKKIKGQVYNRVSMAESESYMLVRYEDLVSDPQKRMGDVFGFLQASVSDEMKQRVKFVAKVNITELYDDVSDHFWEIGREQCAAQIRGLGYPLTRATT